MSLKKIAAVMIAGIFAFSLMAGTADAARGGAKLGGARPKVTTPAPKTTSPSADKKVSPNNKDYSPSKTANEYSKTPPGVNPKSPGMPNTGTRWGNVMRGIGFFAGGMLLGSLLSNLLGFGGGFLGDVLGLLFNIILIYALFKFIMYVFRRFKNRGSSAERDNPYNDRNRIENSYNAVQHDKVVDLNKHNDGQSFTGDNYDAKSMADKYRNM